MDSFNTIDLQLAVFFSTLKLRSGWLVLHSPCELKVE